MAKRFKPQKEIKNIKNKEKRALEERRAWMFKRHILIAFQALLGALIGVCFFLYNSNSRIHIEGRDDTYEYSASFYEISKDYFSSEAYSENLNNAVSTLLRYVAIREQMEVKGAFSENKPIDIGVFANRHSTQDYEGPKVEYYLDDLIKWGQRTAGNAELYCSYEFYNAKEYCDFFGLDYDEYVQSDSYVDEDTIVSSFETLKNQYLTVEGKRLEEYVDNLDDYRDLVEYVQSSANDLYSNYTEYLMYLDKYNEDNTNLRFAVTLSSDGYRNLYSNVSKINKGASDSKIESTLKAYGEYIYACPGTLGFVTNTPISYDSIRSIVIDDYGYAFPDDTKLWIALDSKLPVKDVFYENKTAFEQTKRLVPFVVSLGAISLVGFIFFSVYIIQKEKKLYSGEGAKEKLGYIDRMPIEIGLLFFVLLVLIIFLGESILIKRINYEKVSEAAIIFVPSVFFLFFDLYISLIFMYGFSRRIICKNLWDGSISSYIWPSISKYTGRIRKWIYIISDSGNVALKTWTGYIVFLLFNVFWACMLFFGEHPMLAFIVLLIFDVAIGIFLFNKNWEREKILEGIKLISSGDYNYKIDNIKMHGDNKEFADAVNDMGLGLKRAVEISTRDEKLKADLITNVSHDIKTPLTSIINYVDLLKRENIEDARIKKYIGVLDEKSQRLKQLTFDLVEASKITSGNISIDFIKVDLNEFIKQALGEFEEKYEEKSLDVVLNVPMQASMINADPRHMWRVLENLLNNIYKYSLENTRVYIDLVVDNDSDPALVILSFKNISGQQLNIAADELTERFIRGDVSRSTEGSGLGLSIAKSLTEAQKGSFEIYLDGDLFKVTLTFEKQD